MVYSKSKDFKALQKISASWTNNLFYYHHSSHATYNLTGHLVWITKYRKKVLTPEIIERIKIIITWICKEQYINILAIWCESDHVHCLLSLPITADIPQTFQYLKWRTSKVLWDEFHDYLKETYKYSKKKRWTNKRIHHLWAVWYFFASVWLVDENTIRRYVEEQGKEEIKDEEQERRWIEVFL
jgi:putative transposase